MNSVPVEETFQSTLQGEGYWAGAVSDFIRLAGCPVGCRWCDQGYGVEGGQGQPRSLRGFEELIDELRSPRVVITGGEPFIHRQLPELVTMVLATGRQVSLETSGAFWQPISDSAWVTLSPKEHLNPRYPVQPQFWQRANEIKLVISDSTEIAYYQAYLQEHRVFLQPEWYELDRTLPLTVMLLRQFPQFRLSVQLHKYIGLP